MELEKTEDREHLREQKLSAVWNNELNEVFENIAEHYDVANYVASFGMWGWYRHNFMKTISVNPRERVLDVCAGTNAIGIALLKRESTLEVYAIDRSCEMQAVGKRNANSLGFRINSTIGDVHQLPYPDNYFDIVTLQFASRHLRVREVFSEIYRVLKPGGRFHHCDMLRPAPRLINKLYYKYLSFMLWFTATLFGSGKAAQNCQKYFIDALQIFYSISEFSALLISLGYTEVMGKGIFFDIIGVHRAVKPKQAINHNDPQ